MDEIDKRMARVMARLAEQREACPACEARAERAAVMEIDGVEQSRGRGRSTGGASVPALRWKKHDAYAIKSECGRYSICSIGFNGSRAYEVWRTREHE